MRLQLDTTNKTISIDQEVTVGDLLDTLEALLPNGRWADYRLIPNQIIQWATYPMYITPPTVEETPWHPWIIAKDHTGSYDVRQGVYNVTVDG